MRTSRTFPLFSVILVLLAALLVTVTGTALRLEERSSQSSSAAAITPVIPYQGRLLDPNTNTPKADGSYTMTFRIYDAATGGTALWTETKDVTVSDGLFATYLGDTTALDPAIFDGSERWLGVKVGADAEAVPRMQLDFAPYALWSANADTLDGQDSTAYVNAVGPETITGSSTSPVLTVTQNGSGAAIEAQGGISADSITYNTPRSHTLSIMAEAFQPGSDVAYYNTYGTGGAYINATGGHALVAPVYLPDGAVVTKMVAYFNDTSTGDMTVYLHRLSYTAGGFTILAQVSSSGTGGYYARTDTTITNATIDNVGNGYGIYAYSSAWDSGLRLMGVEITYTINEAP
jgi:hypothetical protein